jgi:hypothetical protein
MSWLESGAYAGQCGHCGMIHGGPCPRIKAIEYYPDGTVKRIEYHGEQGGQPTMPLLPLIGQN